MPACPSTVRRAWGNDLTDLVDQSHFGNICLKWNTTTMNRSRREAPRAPAHCRGAGMLPSSPWYRRRGCVAHFLAYVKDGQRPFCDVMLDSGERVQVTLDRGGATIERLAGGGVRELLFRGSPETMARICIAFQQPGSSRAPLEVIAALVVGLGSAEKVRAAFRSAAAGLG
jgi:hypothetical protein